MTGFEAVIGFKPVTGRCVFLSRDAIQICPPRVKATSFRSSDSVKFAASARPPDIRAGFDVDGDTVHKTPSLANRISSGETHANDEMSDVRMSGRSEEHTSELQSRSDL